MKTNSRSIAEKFIRGQFKIMKKYGSMPKLDEEEYRKLVVSAQKTFQSLTAEAHVPLKKRAKTNSL